MAVSLVLLLVSGIVPLGWVLPYFGPLFYGFSIRLGPYFIPQHNPIDSLFLQEKIG